MRRFGPALRFTLLAVAACLASSCGRERSVIGPAAAIAVRPDEAANSSHFEAVKQIEPESGHQGFYPLVVGDTRTYRTQSSEQRTWDDGRQEPVSAFTLTSTKRIPCVSYQDGREYFTETTSRPAGSDNVVAHWYSWQDREGLHRRFQLASPPCDAGVEAIVATPQTGVAFASNLILAYPLHVGARWALDPTQPEYQAVVEGVDIVNVPAGRFVAWRVRMPTPSANDTVRYWYSREGYIKMAGSYHYVVPSNPAGQGFAVTGSYDEVLTSRVIDPR